MKIIDYASTPGQSGKVNNFISGIQKTLNEALSGPTDAKAEEFVVERFRKSLTNKFFLLRNVTLEGVAAPIPMILVSPAGVYVIAATPVKGVFRVKDDTWAEMKGKDREFQPVRPNLIQRSLQMVQSVENFFTEKGVQSVGIQAVLMFTSPGTHVEKVRPAVRVLLIDGIEPFISGLLTMPHVLTSEDVLELVGFFRRPEAESEKPQEDKRDPFDFMEEKGPSKPAIDVKVPDAAITNNLVTLSNKFQMSPRQWVFIGAMVLVEILLLMGFIIIIMITT